MQIVEWIQLKRGGYYGLPKTLVPVERADKRSTMTTSDVLSIMVQRLVERFQPIRIILFGSRARGDDLPGTILRPALREGITVYERT